MRVRSDCRGSVYDALDVAESHRDEYEGDLREHFVDFERVEPIAEGKSRIESGGKSRIEPGGKSRTE